MLQITKDALWRVLHRSEQPGGVCAEKGSFLGGRPAIVLYLFTPTRYSMVLASTDRPDLADPAKATADELRALWGPLLANAGTYEISGDRITIHPIVAKHPVVMKPGATEVYQFKVDGATLTLRQVRNARGIGVDSAPTLKFVRVE